MKYLFLAFFISFSSMAADCDLQADIKVLTAEARALAGNVDSVANRTIFFNEIFLKGHENYDFLLLANHGGLQILDLVNLATLVPGFMYPAGYEKKLKSFQEGLLDINREVFIYLYTEYYLAKKYYQGHGLESVLTQERITLLTELFEKRHFSVEDKKRFYLKTLMFEQQNFVVPKLQAVYERIASDLFDFVVRRPKVSMPFFPRGTFFLFRDFLNVDERMEKATKAWELAQSAGVDVVLETLSDYKNNSNMPFVTEDELSIQYAKSRRSQILQGFNLVEFDKTKSCRL